MERSFSTRKLEALLSALVFIGVLTGVPEAHAQLVYIPSDGLRGELQALHPEIFIGDSLDTAAPELAAIDSLHLADYIVPDFEWGFEGMQYFTGLRSLFLSWQFVQPGGEVWPPNLERLDLQSGGSYLDAGSWAPLPATLRALYVDNVSFTAPFTLTGPLQTVEYRYVRAAGDAEAAWPQLPEGTTSFLGHFCTVDWGGYTFPSTLEHFRWDGYLEELPDLSNTVTQDINVLGVLDRMAPLPVTLRYFFADWVSEQCLPVLPDSLEGFSVGGGAGPFYALNIPATLELAPSTQIELATYWNSTCLGSNHITGAVFSDVDGDGAQDVGEPPIIATVNAGPSLISGSSGLDGIYDLVTPAGDFTITPVVGPYQAFIGTAPTAQFDSIGLTDAGNDLPLTLEPNIQDLQVSITASPMRPGFHARAWVTYRNVGTEPMDGSVQFTYDAALGYIGSTPTPDVVADNVLTYDFSNLAIGEARIIAIDLQATPSAELGATVVYEGQVQPLATDHVPGDNTVAFTDSIVGSYDPNDMQVWPTELTLDDIEQRRPVEYTIHFQNTGTYLAENVLVSSTLNMDLDATSFTFVASSHPCRWQVMNGMLQVDLPGIQLPDSGSDMAGSQGFVKFRIVPRSTLAAGSSVGNTASIYFDYNAPVLTGEAVFTVALSTGVVTVEAPNVQVWPNPATGLLNIRVDGTLPGTPFTLLDAIGRTVRRGVLMGGRAVLDVSGLAPGHYVLHVLGERGNMVRTIVRP